jgi:DNA-binding beta-propeller fold protein YncE
VWTNGKGLIDSARADQQLDWDGNGAINDGVKVDTNLLDGEDKNVPAQTCETPNNGQQGLQGLSGHDDWEQLNAALAGPDAVSADEHEPTTAQMVAAFESRDALFFPDETVQLLPEKAGLRGGVLGVAMDADHIYATHNYRSLTPPGAVDGNGTLLMLDRETLAVEAQVRVGLDARAVAVNPVTKRAYVVNRGTGTGSTLSVIKTATRSVIKEIALGQIAVDVEVNTRLNRVYVSNRTQESLQVINGATNSLLAPVKVGKGLGGMAVDEASGIVYIAMTHRSSEPSFTALARVKDNGTVRTVLPQVDLGDPGIQATDVTLDPGRNRVYVGGLGGGTIAPTVTVLDMTSMQQLARIPMRGPVRAIDGNTSAGLVFAIGDRGVDVIDTGSLTVTRRIDAGLPFAGATENGTGTQLYVGDSTVGQLRRVSYTSGKAV